MKQFWTKPGRAEKWSELYTDIGWWPVTQRELSALKKDRVVMARGLIITVSDRTTVMWS